MATSALAAALAAGVASTPSRYDSLAPGAFAMIAASGADLYQSGQLKGTSDRQTGTALPSGAGTPPNPLPERTPASACPPITTIDDRVAADSGSTGCMLLAGAAFLSRTAVCCATLSAIAEPAIWSIAPSGGG